MLKTHPVQFECGIFHPNILQKNFSLCRPPSSVFVLASGHRSHWKAWGTWPSQMVWVLSYRQRHEFEFLQPKLLNVSAAHWHNCDTKGRCNAKVGNFLVTTLQTWWENHLSWFRGQPWFLERVEKSILLFAGCFILDTSIHIDKQNLTLLECLCTEGHWRCVQGKWFKVLWFSVTTAPPLRTNEQMQMNINEKSKAGKTVSS